MVHIPEILPIFKARTNNAHETHRQEIPDNKANFMLELLSNLSFVKVQQEQRAEKTALKAELKSDLQESITELNEVLAGRKQARSVYGFLKELEAEDGL